MLAVYTKILTRQAGLFSRSINQSTQRNLFTHEYLKLDVFKNYMQKIQQTQSDSLESTKSAISQALSNPDGKIFTDDLKKLLYQTESDENLDLLLSAIKKYQTQDFSSLFKFNFEAPLMRLLYTMNKIDKAIEVFDPKSVEENKFTNLGQVNKMILNKLLEDKRFDDAIKFYKANEHFIKKRTERDIRDFLKLVTLALFEINTPEALSQAKQLVKDFADKTNCLTTKAKVSIFMLAINQNDFEYAYEAAGWIGKSQNNIYENNTKIIALCKLDRFEEALSLSATATLTKNYRFSKETIDALKLSAAKSNLPDNVAAVEQLFSKIEIEKMLSDKTLEQFVRAPTNIRKENDFIPRNQNLSFNERTNTPNRYNNQQRNDGESRPQRSFQQKSYQQRNYPRDEGEERNYQPRNYQQRNYPRDEGEERNYQPRNYQQRNYPRNEDEEGNYRQRNYQQRNYPRDEGEERNYQQRNSQQRNYQQRRSIQDED